MLGKTWNFVEVPTNEKVTHGTLLKSFELLCVKPAYLLLTVCIHDQRINVAVHSEWKTRISGTYFHDSGDACGEGDLEKQMMKGA